ncbi:B-cell lymphoma/leukemia 10 [Brachionichthys hirsutus]|uniref:B-cell lymphoma/leukemia 10 n=1 Tax=Brachionichthys hirsutus TaxID=412623 RepID=UPI0036050225
MDDKLTEEEMAELKKDVLIRLRHYLCDKIRAERHLDYLRSRRILTRDDAEEISCRTTQTKRTAMLLDILSENPRGLDALTDSIREMRSQNFIIAKITDEVQKAKNEKMESLRAAASSSSEGIIVSPSAATDLPALYSNDSTLLLHPDGEQSLCASAGLPSHRRSDVLPSGFGAGVDVASCTTSSTLPRPGEPGAPPLPDEVMVESQSNVDAGEAGCASGAGGGDSNFQPLRSRSLTPTSHRSVF